MTQPPVNPQYYTPPPPGSVGRPTSVLVLSIIGIIVSAYGILCAPLGVAFLFVNMGMPNPAIDQIKNNAFLFNYTVVGTALGFIMSVLLLVCSIGAITLKPWARKGLLVWAGITIVTVLIGFVVTVGYILPNMAPPANTPQSRGAAIGGMIGGIAGGLIQLILPVLILIFMTRPRVVAAFEDARTVPYSP